MFDPDRPPGRLRQAARRIRYVVAACLRLDTFRDAARLRDITDQRDATLRIVAELKIELAEAKAKGTVAELEMKTLLARVDAIVQRDKAVAQEYIARQELIAKMAQATPQRQG